MKKEAKVLISVILAIWFFFMGFELGSYREKKAISTAAPEVVTTAPVITTGPIITEAPTTSPTTTEPEKEEETTTAANNENETSDTAEENDETTAATEDSTNADPSSMSKEDIIKEMETAINAAKQEQNMTAKKTEVVTINLTDLSVPGAMSAVNSIMQRLAGEEVVTYEFVNGQANGIDQDGKTVDEGVSPNHVLHPDDATLIIPADGVASATAEKQGDNTVYSITLVEENTTFTAPIPAYNSAVFSYLDLTSVDLTGVSITDATMHYPGTQVTATVNAEGKLISLRYNMPMDGTGAARITFFNGNASFEGGDDEAWEFTY